MGLEDINRDSELHRAEHARIQRKADFREVLSTPAGRRVLELVLFEFGGLQAQSRAAETDLVLRHTGQRDVATHLEAELQKSARAGWALMHAERIERLKNEPVDSANKTDQ